MSRRGRGRGRRPGGAGTRRDAAPRADAPGPAAGPDDEPAFDDDDVVECGGELIYVAGTTDGGAPYGVPLDELRRALRQDAGTAPWARARAVLEELISRELGPVRDLGRVTKIGEGLSRDHFAVEVELEDGRCAPYVVALPRRDAEPGLDERTRRELRVTWALRSFELPFRVPEYVGAIPHGDHLVLVRRFVRGIDLDLRAGRQPSVRAWDVVATIAAAIHALPSAPFAQVVPGADTRRAHASAALSIFDGLDAPELRAAHAWALAHLPPAEPASLLHGDLLGQNILLSLDGPDHVIDWEYATLGDPAYDLALVTRGVKRPFQLPRGLDQLLDAYHRAGGRAVTAADIHLHELCLLAGWYRDALARERRARDLTPSRAPAGHSAAHELDLVRSLLRRLH